MANGWGPEGRQAAASFTFDNLGEASDIEFGRWPTERPVGTHHSAMRDLPLILDALAGINAKVGFFIESWNLHVYPDVVRAVAEAGHEIGSHGLRHEIWCNLTPDQEHDHMKRCIDDFARYGMEIKGLRPPGGIVARGSAEVLPKLGITYIAPIGLTAGVLDTGLAVLKTEIAASDVVFYSPAFTKYRNHKAGEHTLGPDDFVEGMMAEIEKAVRKGEFISTTCHPFVQSPRQDHTDPARVEAIAEVVRRINADPRIWHATPGEVADWMIKNKGDYPPPPSLEPPDYWNPAFYNQIRRDFY